MQTAYFTSAKKMQRRNLQKVLSEKQFETTALATKKMAATFVGTDKLSKVVARPKTGRRIVMKCQINNEAEQ